MSILQILALVFIFLGIVVVALVSSYMIFVRSKSIDATIVSITPPVITAPLHRDPVYKLKVSYIDPKSGQQKFAFVEKPAPLVDSDFTYKVGDHIRIML